MSDIRFILAGVALVFAGFLVLGVMGAEYRDANVQISEFDNCLEYSADDPPEAVDCNQAVQGSIAFFAGVLALLGAGVFALIKGYRGRWDNEVRPEEMLGPGGRRKDDGDDQD